MAVMVAAALAYAGVRVAGWVLESLRMAAPADRPEAWVLAAGAALPIAAAFAGAGAIAWKVARALRPAR